MKECGILGGKNILRPLLHIFRGSRPNPQDYAPEYHNVTDGQTYRNATDTHSTDARLLSYISRWLCTFLLCDSRFNESMHTSPCMTTKRTYLCARYPDSVCTPLTKPYLTAVVFDRSLEWVRKKLHFNG